MPLRWVAQLTGKRPISAYRQLGQRPQPQTTAESTIRSQPKGLSAGVFLNFSVAVFSTSDRSVANGA